MLPPFAGPSHPYIGASSACWALFGEVLAREFNDAKHMSVHGTTVDTYAVQHPGIPERRSTQSVSMHLVRMCLVLEFDVPPDSATKLMPQVKRHIQKLRWLEPPIPNGEITVMDILQADPAEHNPAVLGWARDVWNAWSEHHALVRTWVSAVRG